MCKKKIRKFKVAVKKAAQISLYIHLDERALGSRFEAKVISPKSSLIPKAATEFQKLTVSSWDTLAPLAEGHCLLSSNPV